MRTKEEIKKEIDLVDKEICSIEYVADDPERYNELCRKINRLMEIYSIISNPQVASSDELDIYAEKKSKTNYIYHLMLHETEKSIGYVRVTYDEGKTIFGNIGYEIHLRYRGHNFAYKALEMLEDTMLQNGLTNPIITADPSNTPSLRIIEKFGGELIGDTTTGLTYNRYQVDLLKKKDKDIKQKSKHL